MNKEAKRAQAAPADAPTSTTPHSSSSNSSGKTSSQNGTHSSGRFKEKRPEPLKLNPNLNQEIPLDLSVKSAGNAPSGLLGNMFSLSSAGRLHSLETPSILWQDNEALLIKPRHLSTNSSLAGTQRAHLSSASMGNSPPATPETPFPDMLCSPAAGPRAGSAGAPLSASLLQASSECSSSLRAFMSAQLQQQYSRQTQARRQIRQLGRPAQPAGEPRLPRRSCSTEELSLFGPAAKNPPPQPRVHYNRFSYITATGGGPQAPEAGGADKATTPTSVAKATANLLNITLNSPTGDQKLAVETRNILSSSTDPILSLGAHQRISSSSTSSCFVSDHLQQQHYCQPPHHLLSSQPGSLSSSTTLNTPTLISPSQLKQHGSLSFLPSPTLSPFSSVFEMPSPLLVFPAAPAPAPPSSSSSGESRVASQQALGKQLTSPRPTAPASAAVTTSDQALNRAGSLAPAQAPAGAVSEGNLAHLVTPAREKVGAAALGERAVVKMEVEEEAALPPAVIPRITVSSSQQPQQQAPVQVQARSQTPALHYEQQEPAAWTGPERPGQPRVQRDQTDKRALSPHSFRLRVSQYHGQRHESSSAPPDVTSRARPAKIKAVDPFDYLWSGEQAAGSGQLFYGPRQALYRPYPDPQAGYAGRHCSARSNSAEPQPSGCWPCDSQPPAPKLAPPAPYYPQPQPDPQQQPAQHQYQQLQPHYNHPGFSQSAQHLAAAPSGQRLSAGPCAQSVSAGELQRAELGDYCAGPLPSSMSQLDNLLLQQQHQQLQQQRQQPCAPESRAMSADGAAGLQRDYLLGFRSASAAGSCAAKKYNCDQCSKAFTRSDMLTRHKRLHSGDRPFRCNECQQEFSRSDHLSTHMRTHTGEKPYKCKLCAYSACRKDMITRHMKVHNRSSNSEQSASAR